MSPWNVNVMKRLLAKEINMCRYFCWCPWFTKIHHCWKESVNTWQDKADHWGALLQFFLISFALTLFFVFAKQLLLPCKSKNILCEQIRPSFRGWKSVFQVEIANGCWPRWQQRPDVSILLVAVAKLQQTWCLDYLKVNEDEKNQDYVGMGCAWDAVSFFIYWETSIIILF